MGGRGTGADFGVKIIEAFQRVDQLLVGPFGRVGILQVRLLLLLLLGRQRDGDVYGRLRHGERGGMEYFLLLRRRECLWSGDRFGLAAGRLTQPPIPRPSNHRSLEALYVYRVHVDGHVDRAYSTALCLFYSYSALGFRSGLVQFIARWSEP